MNQNKNIDDIFREHLKDFEKKPDHDVWEAIESRLSKKERQKPIFMWYKIAGIAAMFLLLFSIGFNIYQNNINRQLREIVIKPNTDINLNDDKIVTLKSEGNATNTINQKYTNSNEKSSKTNSNKLINTPKNKFLTITKNVINQQRFNKQLNKSTLTTTTNDKIKTSTSKDLIALNKVEKTVGNELNDNVSENNSSKIKEKKDLISTDNELALKKDTEKINIETLLNEVENDTKKSVKSKKLSIGSSFSPIYYSSLSNSSSIDTNLDNNSTSNEYSSSYGVKVEYKMSDKWSVQTGVHNMDLNYTTNNVVATIFEPIAGSPSELFSNVRSVANKLVILTPTNDPSSLSSIQNNIELDDSNKLLTADGKLTQNVSYIEIPLELKYKVIDKKIAVQVLGGFSTLLLNKNELVLDNNVDSYLLGKATNINNTSFSANLGVDIKYDISEKFYINLSPNFKYQINTFSNNDGGFEPYQIGINTGLNFRF